MLLPIINEKIFYNGPVPTKIPLISMFAASNELPDDESLQALYDRLLIRMEVEYIKDAKNRERMYKLYATKGAGIQAPTKITLDELHAIQEVAESLPINKNVFPALNKLIQILGRTGIKISDRRQNNCIKIMRGNALLSGRRQVTTQDLEALVYVLWEKKEDIELIETEITKLIDPYTVNYKQYAKQFADIVDKLNNAQNVVDNLQDSNSGATPEDIQEAEKANITTLMECRKSLETLSKRVTKKAKEVAKDGVDTSKFTALISDINNISNELSAKWLNTDPSILMGKL